MTALLSIAAEQGASAGVVEHAAAAGGRWTRMTIVLLGRRRLKTYLPPRRVLVLATCRKLMPLFVRTRA